MATHRCKLNARFGCSQKAGIDTQPEWLLLAFGAQIFFKVFFLYCNVARTGRPPRWSQKGPARRSQKGLLITFGARISSRCFFFYCNVTRTGWPSNWSQKDPARRSQNQEQPRTVESKPRFENPGPLFFQAGLRPAYFLITHLSLSVHQLCKSKGGIVLMR